MEMEYMKTNSLLGENKVKEKPKYGSIKAEILVVLVQELGYWKIAHNLDNLMIE